MGGGPRRAGNYTIDITALLLSRLQFAFTEVWVFHGNRIAVCFAYEWHDDSDSWWEFDEEGLTRLRLASINDLPIKESERRYHWPLGRRPDNHPSLTDLGL